MESKIDEIFMKADEYKEEYFGQAVPFNIVKNDADKYAKIFAEESPALEGLLKNLWSHDIETIACCTGYNDGSHRFSVTNEKLIQEKYDQYLKTPKIKRVFMDKNNCLPIYKAYITFDKSTIINPETFISKLEENLKKIGPEATIEINSKRVKRGMHVGSKEHLGVYITVLRNKECIYDKIDKMTRDEIIKFASPEKTTFDKYFITINNSLEKCYEQYQNKSLTPWTDRANQEIGTDINIKEYSEEQLKQLVIAKRHEHDITSFANPEQTPEQLCYIYTHMELGDDVSKYINNTKFNPNETKNKDSAEFMQSVFDAYDVRKIFGKREFNREQTIVLGNAEAENMEMSKIKILANKNLTAIEMEYLKELLSKSEYSKEKIAIANKIIGEQIHKKPISFNDTFIILKGVAENKSEKEIIDAIFSEPKDTNIMSLKHTTERSDNEPLVSKKIEERNVAENADKDSKDKNSIKRLNENKRKYDDFEL